MTIEPYEALQKRAAQLSCEMAMKSSVAENRAAQAKKKQDEDLLDYFAGLALQGICASGPSVDYSDEKIANESYNLAEAMLKVKRQRSKS